MPPPNYNKPNHHSQRQRHHQTTTNPTTIPSAITKHRNLAQKHIPKSTETQKSTQPKINRNPKINPTQNQLKLTGKPNPKTVHTHRKTQPNGAESATRSAATGSSIAAAESSIAIVGWRWEAKGRLWRRDGGQKWKGGWKQRGKGGQKRKRKGGQKRKRKWRRRARSAS